MTYSTWYNTPSYSKMFIVQDLLTWNIRLLICVFPIAGELFE